MKRYTHFLGMELQYVAYAVTLWNEANRPCRFEIAGANKSDLVVIKIVATENDYPTNALVNKIWKATRCRLESK